MSCGASSVLWRVANRVAVLLWALSWLSPLATVTTVTIVITTVATFPAAATATLTTCSSSVSVSQCRSSSTACQQIAAGVSDKVASPAATPCVGASYSKFVSCSCVDCADVALGSVPCDIPPDTNILLLSNTGLTTLPNNGFFADLALLNYLDLSGNLLTTLEHNMLSNINRSALPLDIDLSHNPITAIEPYAFNQTNIFGDIVLDYLRVSSLVGGAFTGCTAQDGSVLLRHGIIQEFDVMAFSGLTAVDLDLSNNSVTTLPIAIFSGMDLNGAFNLQNNKLTTIVRDVFGSQGSATTISTLNLKNNLIESLAVGQFAGLKIIGDIILSYNRVTTVTEFVFTDLDGILLSVDLSHNRITNIDSRAFESLNVQFDLDLSFNHISNLNTLTFGHLVVGKTLNLSHNNITKLPAMVFRRVVVGSVLDLSYNQLAEMEGKTFFGLNAADATVQLSDNKLTSIAEAFFGIGGPSVVNLNNNNVSVLEPQWFAPLSMRVVMHMDGNPSQCRVTVLEQISDVVECTCAPGTAGNGRYCSKAPCLRQVLESQAQVDHGRFVCDTVVDNFEDCTLVCDNGYQPQGQPARCFGGEWGSPTDVPYIGRVGKYPVCTPEPGHLDVGAVVGGVLGALAVLLIVAFVYRRRFKKVLFSTQVELSLQERLLAETQQTVVALKQGWRVLPQEIKLLHRLDEGAVGEVWQGLWNDLPVAVKSLKKAHLFGDMDDSFQTEVEFLMTLRHPNVVLFFWVWYVGWLGLVWCRASVSSD